MKDLCQALQAYFGASASNPSNEQLNAELDPFATPSVWASPEVAFFRGLLLAQAEFISYRGGLYLKGSDSMEAAKKDIDQIIAGRVNKDSVNVEEQLRQVELLHNHQHLDEISCLSTEGVAWLGSILRQVWQERLEGLFPQNLPCIVLSNVRTEDGVPKPIPEAGMDWADMQISVYSRRYDLSQAFP